MSPPATKKSASGKEGPRSSGAASGRGGKAKASGKSAAKTGTGKSAPKKKRRKKKGTGKFKALAAAFAAGLLAASLGLWYLLGMPVPELRFSADPGQESAVVQQDRGQAKELAAERAAPRQASAPGKGSDARSSKSSKSGKQSPAKQADAPKGQDKTDAANPAGASQPAPADGQKAASAPRSVPDESAVSGAVASALIDLQSLPYEESLQATLDERIRQVDYALMQAAWMRALPARSLRLAALEDRLEGLEPYQFQRIEVLPGSDARAFTAALKDCLAAWAEGALLTQSGKDNWSVSIGEVQTHSIRLYPGRGEFPPLPGAAGAGKEPPAVKVPAVPPPGQAPPRVRAGHEAPRLVIVIDDLGASPSALKQLLALDFPVTMAFWPHGAHTREGALAAHARGAEILVHQPMEPLGYPKMQPGPNVLLTGMSEARIRKALLEGIAAVPHAVGLNNHMGSRFTQSREGVSAVIRLLKERGLFMLDSLTDSRSVFADQGRRMGIKYYRRNVFLDVEHSREAVLAALERAERIALLSGQAVAIGHPLPQTLAGLKDWQKLRNKKVRIVRLGDLAQE